MFTLLDLVVVVVVVLVVVAGGRVHSVNGRLVFDGKGKENRSQQFVLQLTAL